MAQRIIIRNGNRMWTRSREPANRVLTCDGVLCLATRELRLSGQADTAERLSPVWQEWPERPWLVGRVIRWEAAIEEALEADLGPFRKKQLRHILARVKSWIKEYDEAEVEDWRDYVRQARWGPQDERD